MGLGSMQGTCRQARITGEADEAAASGPPPFGTGAPGLVQALGISGKLRKTP